MTENICDVIGRPIDTENILVLRMVVDQELFKQWIIEDNSRI